MRGVEGGWVAEMAEVSLAVGGWQLAEVQTSDFPFNRGLAGLQRINRID